MTDVSQFKASGGKLYLSPIMDMYDGYIVSYDISISPDFAQTKRMIDKAFEDNPDLEDLIFHSDQGLAIPDEALSEMVNGQRHPAVFLQERQLYG